MKKKILATLMLAAMTVFTDEIAIPFSPFPDTKIPVQEASSTKQGYFYLRFMTADSDLAYSNSITPGMGIGYRRLAGDGAIDVSMNGNGSAHYSQVYWTVPKLSYFHYLTPNEETSLYAGAGLAWGGVHGDLKRDFIGIIPSVTVGYEFAHKSPLLGFVELNVSQPAVPLEVRGRFPGPLAELSIGGGF